MYKVVNIVLLLVIVLIGGSCTNGTSKLEKALKEIDNNSYTVECLKEIEFAQTYTPEIYTYEIDIYFEKDDIQLYMSTISDDVESYVYMLKTEKTKKVFTKKQASSKWEELKGFELAAYENEFDKMYTISAVGKFVEKDGEWVGDVELLKPYVKEYIDEFADDLRKNEGKIKRADLTKYNIILDGRHISEIKIDILIELIFDGFTSIVTNEMTFKFSNIGKTKVTKPYII